ncbi:zinc finger protein [Salpingoeca rosetta]|uniref:Zinc finger protein n=1 Tax=Salpingoeca rosetta (strain ATCC 50818 / BSB-021) TaxID=946362 RepID=F2U0U5_SALR5|nr:zinc finger protein [Salpingoeca rosetta]EGD80519.1 zinc finger protein [Salpingoeca rosetta]|eukprot:XP_004997080.1 zinc finger protein [Salpingoeca rosetta]
MSRDMGSAGGDDRMPALYKIYRVAVTSIKEYGAFVEMEGFNKKALLHISQMSQSRINDPTEVVSVGDPLFAKVIEIKEDGKISVSIKTVRQSDGTDTDTTNIIVEQDNLRKRSVTETEKPRLQLGAVLNTVCSKCGTKGHFAKDCFSVGKRYEVVTAEPEEEELEEMLERRRRRHHHSSSDTGSDSDGSPSEKRAKRGHDDKKKKKRKHKDKKHKDKKHKKKSKKDKKDKKDRRERHGGDDDKHRHHHHHHHRHSDDRERRRRRSE